MRQIKFRAWDKEDKVMIDAESFYFSDEFEPFIHSVERAKQYFEIMQFTGLHDRNGKEIYEGDICECDELLVFVRFKDGMFEYKCINDTGTIHCAALDVKVIDNIYEHPELLKDQPAE